LSHGRGAFYFAGREQASAVELPTELLLVALTTPNPD
jgi:hypothetical protein